MTLASGTIIEFESLGWGMVAQAVDPADFFFGQPACFLCNRCQQRTEFHAIFQGRGLLQVCLPVRR